MPHSAHSQPRGGARLGAATDAGWPSGWHYRVWAGETAGSRWAIRHYKPNIADWMLAPSTDIRASNSLETVQNQYQIQGLELDFTIVAWDADLRREKNGWAAFKLSGSDWQRDKLIDVAKNGYRVILTRARQGMVIFIAEGGYGG
ncbi:MAG: DUF2075 domain-containing protein [Gammaproteobacteria bacterium]|nr:DUF2075 domain-containing protein [Gammaproteobacteria bacterium]